MSLLQGVLKANIEDIEGRLSNVRLNGRQRSSFDEDVNSDDDLVNVVSIELLYVFTQLRVTNIAQISLPASPSHTRPSSPVRGASSRLIKGPLILSSNRRDPLKAFPTELSQKFFWLLPIKELAKCALVCKKWCQSQTLNYGKSFECPTHFSFIKLESVWFRHYRQENFHDDSLPPGKWTKRESKQNWVGLYLSQFSLCIVLS